MHHKNKGNKDYHNWESCSNYFPFIVWTYINEAIDKNVGEVFLSHGNLVGTKLKTDLEFQHILEGIGVQEWNPLTKQEGKQ